MQEEQRRMTDVSFCRWLITGGAVAGACVSGVLVVGKAPTEAAVFANDSAKMI